MFEKAVWLDEFTICARKYFKIVEDSSESLGTIFIDSALKRSTQERLEKLVAFHSVEIKLLQLAEVGLFYE